MEEENKGEFSERPEVTPAESVILPVQKKSKVATILCVILAITVVGLSVFIACDKLLVKDDKKDNTTPGSVAISDEDKAIVEKYKREQKLKDISKELRDVVRIYLGGKLDVAITAYDYASVAGRVDAGKDLSTAVWGTYTTLIEPHSGDQVEGFIEDDLDFALPARVAESLQKQGFKKDEALSGGMWSIEHYETEDGLICEFTTNKSFPYYISCGDVSNISEEKKDLVRALGEAYKKSEGEEISYITAAVDDIKDGANGHQRITAGGENAALLFYRNSSDSEWVFYKGTQAALDCDEFNNDDLRNAFVGETCWDKSGVSSTVKAK